jgi:hypothetical protein
VKLKILGVSRYYFKGDTPIMLGPSLEVAYWWALQRACPKQTPSNGVNILNLSQVATCVRVCVIVDRFKPSFFT